MTDNDKLTVNHDELPYVAPCRQLTPWAPFRWIRRGVADLLQAPQQSMAYGLAVAALMGIVSLLAWFQGGEWIVYAILGEELGFLGTLTVMGLFVALMWSGAAMAYRSRDLFGRGPHRKKWWR